MNNCLIHMHISFRRNIYVKGDTQGVTEGCDPLALTTAEAMWGDSRVVPLGGVGLSTTENIMLFIYVPPISSNSH